MKGDLEILDLILENLPAFDIDNEMEKAKSDDENHDFESDHHHDVSRGDQKYFSKVNLNWSEPIKIATIYENVSVLQRLLEYGVISFSEGKLLYLCEKTSNPMDFFNIFLNSPMFTEIDDQNFQIEWFGEFTIDLFKVQSKWLVAWLNFVFDHLPDVFPQLMNNLDDEDRKQMMTHLLQDKKKESAKVALKGAFACGIHQHFKTILNQWEWDQSDLLDLLRIQFQIEQASHNVKTSQHILNLQLVLKELNSNTQIIATEIEELLNSYDEAKEIECFKLLWNDKRIVRTQDWINQFTTSIDFRFRSDKSLMNFLISQCTMSGIVKREIGEENMGMDEETVEIEFRNHLFLNELYERESEVELEEIERRLEIKWSEDLLILCIKDSQFEESLEMIWNQVDRALKTEKAVRCLLSVCFRRQFLDLIDRVLKEFPNLDLSGNDHELLRSFLKRFTFQEMFVRISPDDFNLFSKLESRIQFESESKREELKIYAEKCLLRKTKSFATEEPIQLIQKISKIKIVDKK